MRKIKFIITILIILGIFSIFFYSYQINYPLAKEGEEISFVIESGRAPQEIAESLEKQKIIKSSFWLRYYLKSKDLANKVIAGTFSLSPTMSISQIAKKITTVNSISTEEEIVLIEGWNASEIGEYLETKDLCSQKEWLSLVKNYKNSNYDFLNDKSQVNDLEGYLFPDTYRIYKDSDCADILVKLLNNFDRKLTKEMKKEIKFQKKTIFEIITMASVIEKEVTSIKDMKIVSGLFWDRIKNRQALESCATLAYILGENKAQYSLEDTQINSPYNTYRHRGLPLGPITNPGLNAIQAAIYPTQTGYNYFLSDPKTGNTIWSKTFEEHIQNKWKYLN
jgi:peptidoglycan lytic transglycosylase G